MRKSFPLAPLAVAALTSCASKPAPATTPLADAAALGAPLHHCTEQARIDAAVEVLAATAIPVRDDLAPQLRAAERMAFEAARPVFARYCLRCHSSGSKKVKPSTLEKLDMTTYPFTSRHGDAIATRIRTVLGLDGSDATMPLVNPGCIAPGDMERVAAWAYMFDRAHELHVAP